MSILERAASGRHVLCAGRLVISVVPRRGGQAAGRLGGSDGGGCGAAAGVYAVRMFDETVDLRCEACGRRLKRPLHKLRAPARAVPQLLPRHRRPP